MKHRQSREHLSRPLQLPDLLPACVVNRKLCNAEVQAPYLDLSRDTKLPPVNYEILTTTVNRSYNDFFAKYSQVRSWGTSKMAPASTGSMYAKDEKALCFHHELLYEAKVLDARPVDPNDKKGVWQYKVHYKGWKNT